MRSLIYLGPGDLQWREVAAPRLAGDGGAIVGPVAVATCDLDALIVSGGSPFPAPFAIGHEGVAEALEVGDRVRSVKTGDLVLVPFQISCGTCGACLAGRTGSCETVPGEPTYGLALASRRHAGAAFSLIWSMCRMPTRCVPMPDGLAPELAAGASDNITDAYRAVAPALAARPGAAVLVCGGTLDIALVTTRVVAFDHAADALAEDYTKLIFTR